ncbi:MAG: DUF4350 domain-containing protein, partial [Halobacteria archaeon]|nr:DUF4350 domain-containing protein [Halobacteria archaeon]
LIDTSHSNRFETEDIRPLISAIIRSGYRVEFTSFSSDLESKLSKADAFVVIDPGTDFSEEEARAIKSFVQDGGRLVMIGEPNRMEVGALTLTTIRNHLTSLSSEFGIEFGTGYLYNMQTEFRDGNHQNIFSVPKGESSFAQGIDRTVFYTATQVEAEGGNTVLVSEEGTQNSRSNNAQTYGTAVIKGNVMAIGDKTFLKEGRHNVADNEKLITRIVEFLVTGERDRHLSDYPYIIEENPTVAFTSPELLSSAQELGNGLQGEGINPTITLKKQGIRPTNTDILITTFDFMRKSNMSVSGVEVTTIDNTTRFSVSGVYEANATDVGVIRSFDNGFDLVIIVDSPSKASDIVDILNDGEIDKYVIKRNIAVVEDEI